MSVIHLLKLETHVCLIRGYEAFMEMNLTYIFLFLIYYICVKTVSSLIKYSYVCVLKSLRLFPKFQKQFLKNLPIMGDVPLVYGCIDDSFVKSI
jgi:hypothetical protein